MELDLNKPSGDNGDLSPKAEAERLSHAFLASIAR
jgi:hypothetical protein